MYMYSSRGISGILHLLETACDSHVLHVDITTGYIFCHGLNGLNLSAGMCDVIVSCDSHMHIPNDIHVHVVAVLIPMYGNR